MFGPSRSSSRQQIVTNFSIKRDEKEREKEKEKEKKYQFIEKQSQLTATNQLTQYFSFRIQALVSQQDPTLAWTYNIPVLSPNQRQLYLAVESFTTSLVDYIGQYFPMQISIGLRNYSGFIGSNGLPTKRIIVLNLYSVQVNQVNGITQRDLIYKNDNSISWPLGSLRTLDFEVYVDDSSIPIPLPLSNPVNLTFKILHVSF